MRFKIVFYKEFEFKGNNKRCSSQKTKTFELGVKSVNCERFEGQSGSVIEDAFWN
jgi:hypothetical protein